MMNRDINNKKQITLLPLTSLDTELQMQIRVIRNEENVRQWMYTDHLITVNEHLAWINRLKSDDSQIVFVVLEDHHPLGIFSVSKIDCLHKKTDWGFYLTKKTRLGLDPAIKYAFINFVFETLGMEKLNCEVIEGNNAVIKLHKKFLFQEEGFRHSNILKHNTRRGVYFLGLTKEAWLLGRKAIREKYSAIFEKYAVSIKWDTHTQDKCAHPIDQIEAARARNNLNWMSILRLAIEKSPDVARPIVADIQCIDREIATITKQLVGDHYEQ